MEIERRFKLSVINKLYTFPKLEDDAANSSDDDGSLDSLKDTRTYELASQNYKPKKRKYRVKTKKARFKSSKANITASLHSSNTRIYSQFQHQKSYDAKDQREKEKKHQKY